MSRRILLGSAGLSAAMAAALVGRESYQDGDETKRIAPMTVPVQTLTRHKPFVQRYRPTDPEIAAWNAAVERSKGRRP